MEILIKDLNFPEGPAFDPQGGIWLVEKEAGNLVYFNDQQQQRIPVGGHPNGIAIDKNGIIWFCDSLKNSIRKYDPMTGHLSTVVDRVDNQPLKMPNDLCFDSHGNLLFTCPGDSLDDGTGYLCCFFTDGICSRIQHNMYYPNGLALATDQQTLYIAETGTKWIWKSLWDATDRSLRKLEKFAYVGGEIGPDGIAFDEDGFLYIAIYGSQKIVILNTEAKIIDEIHLDGTNPTNCAIDPLGKQGLLITEAEKGQLLRFDNMKKGLL